MEPNVGTNLFGHPVPIYFKFIEYNKQNSLAETFFLLSTLIKKISDTPALGGHLVYRAE